MYIEGNPKTKKAFKKLVASGKRVYAFQPGGLFSGQDEGVAFIEGPQYPEPHRWYAKVLLEDRRVVKVIS